MPPATRIPGLARTRTLARSGTVIIVVAGLSALLMAMAVAFLARMRGDSEESLVVIEDAQARMMIIAGCNYIQECSRIGWDRYPYTSASSGSGSGSGSGNVSPVTDSNDAFPGDTGGGAVPVHEETFGWMDVRDGSLGPTTQEGRVVYSTAQTMPWQSGSGSLVSLAAWPAPNSIVRCPMYRWQRPPYATQLTVCYNPIHVDPSQANDSDYLMPYLRYPDPQPQVDNGWSAGAVNATLYDDGQQGATHADFMHGDPTPLPWTQGKAWFRIYRDGPVTFVITAGSGGTLGFRSYQEAVAQGSGAAFNNDPDFFAELAEQEIRIWYRVEWSAYTTDLTYHWNEHEQITGHDHYLQWPLNQSHSHTPWGGYRSGTNDRNMGGTFRFLERLMNEPTNW